MGSCQFETLKLERCDISATTDDSLMAIYKICVYHKNLCSEFRIRVYCNVIFTTSCAIDAVMPTYTLFPFTIFTTSFKVVTCGIVCVFTVWLSLNILFRGILQNEIVFDYCIVCWCSKCANEFLLNALQLFRFVCSMFEPA